MNLARTISEATASYGSKTAIVFPGASYTFKEIDDSVQHYCAMLRRLGVSTGDRVAIQLTKRVEFIFLELAVMSVGAVVLPLNFDYRPEEIEYYLSDSGARLFFTDKDRFDRSLNALQSLKDVVTVMVDDVGSTACRDLKTELQKTNPKCERDYPTTSEDLAAILYTSGTTGKPKGAMLTHWNLVSNMKSLYDLWEWSDKDVLLHVLPMFHVHGLFVALHGALYAGATIIIQEKFDAERTWQTIENTRCTVFMGVPTVYSRLLEHWEATAPKPDLGSMRVFVSGSAPLPEAISDRFEKATGFRLLERYGMTETVMVASNPIDPSARKAKGVGYQLPGVEIRIVSDQGLDVTPGDIGEVWVSGDGVFKGYWRMPEKTAESFEGKWFRTGDLGRQDPDDVGRLYIVGRSKELIITGGYNVYPKEVEDVLMSNDSVHEAAVIGIPDDDFGEKVTAFVVLKPDKQTSSDDLVSFCKEQLARYKCPKILLIVDSLPKNQMGKIQKNELAREFEKSKQAKAF